MFCHAGWMRCLYLIFWAFRFRPTNNALSYNYINDIRALCMFADTQCTHTQRYQNIDDRCLRTPRYMSMFIEWLARTKCTRNRKRENTHIQKYLPHSLRQAPGTNHNDLMICGRGCKLNSAFHRHCHSSSKPKLENHLTKFTNYYLSLSLIPYGNISIIHSLSSNST